MELKKSLVGRFTQRTLAWLTPLFLGCIAIGQFNDTIDVVTKAFEAIRSNFTYDPDYERIERLHVNATLAHVEDTFGAAQISKPIDSDLSADYYFWPSHVVAIAHDDQRVRGYYVQALSDDFRPEFVLPSKERISLGDQRIAGLTEEFKDYVLDCSRNQTYYLEQQELYSSGLFFDFYQGVVTNNLDSELQGLICQVYDDELLDSDPLNDLRALRHALSPNLLGFGNLSQSQLSRMLLTRSELYLFSGS
ncbi:ETEC_3214 domain-containing protein [Aliagarivorans taiwanensis]|uniref:ETEC_3214 domain-containing protein n=1 Tax=Aliagarivorans taiwanensis TaxID=561966 RepID=UPI0003FE914D|nr:ETEC_3214 domain-containing protein [Aliagarivorans taiwanensis]